MSEPTAKAADHHLKQARIALAKAHMHLATARAAYAEPTDELSDMATAVFEMRERLGEIIRDGGE